MLDVFTKYFCVCVCVCAICGHSENLLEFSERTFISFHYARERWKLLSTPQGTLCRASFERLPVGE